MTPAELEMLLNILPSADNQGLPCDADLALFVLGLMDEPGESRILAAARRPYVRRRLADVAVMVDRLLADPEDDLRASQPDVAQILDQQAEAALRIGMRPTGEEPTWCGEHQDSDGRPEGWALVAALVNIDRADTVGFEVGHRSTVDPQYWELQGEIDEIGTLFIKVRSRTAAPRLRRLKLTLRHNGIRLPLGIAEIHNGRAELRALDVGRLLGLPRGGIDPSTLMITACENQIVTRVLYANELEQEVGAFAVITSEPMVLDGHFNIRLRPTDLPLGSVVEAAIPVSHRGSWQRIAKERWNGADEVHLSAKLPWSHQDGIYSGVLRLRRLTG